MNKLIIVYAVILIAGFTALGIGYLAYNNGMFISEPTLEIGRIVAENQMVVAAGAGAAVLFLLIMVAVDMRTQQPKELEYTPIATPKTTSGYNPQPSQPTVYQPRGQTIEEQTTTIHEEPTPTTPTTETVTEVT